MTQVRSSSVSTLNNTVWSKPWCFLLVSKTLRTCFTFHLIWDTCESGDTTPQPRTWTQISHSAVWALTCRNNISAASLLPLMLSIRERDEAGDEQEAVQTCRCLFRTLPELFRNPLQRFSEIPLNLQVWAKGKQRSDWRGTALALLGSEVIRDKVQSPGDCFHSGLDRFTTREVSHCCYYWSDSGLIPLRASPGYSVYRVDWKGEESGESRGGELHVCRNTNNCKDTVKTIL